MKVKFADFRQVTRSRSFPIVIARHDLLRQVSVELVRTLLPTAKGVRLLGVTVSNFEQVPPSNSMCYDRSGRVMGAYIGLPRSYQESASRTRANEDERQARAMPGTRLFVAAMGAIDIARTFNSR